MHSMNECHLSTAGQEQRPPADQEGHEIPIQSKIRSKRRGAVGTRHFEEGGKMNNNEQFLKLPQVIALTSLSRSSIYAYIQKKEFPAPVRISGPGGRAVAWTASSIAAWQEACINTSTSTPNSGGAKTRTTA
jgi:prophage regulatory protein